MNRSVITICTLTLAVVAAAGGSGWRITGSVPVPAPNARGFSCWDPFDNSVLCDGSPPRVYDLFNPSSYITLDVPSGVWGLGDWLGNGITVSNYRNSYIYHLTTTGSVLSSFRCPKDHPADISTYPWDHYVAIPEENLALELTDWLKTPQGTMQLRPVQAAALADAHDFGGLLAPQRVGAGKTILSLLVAEVLDAERPLLIIPAKLKRKTEIDIAQLKQHWRFKRPKIVTYEWLGRVQAAPMEDDKGNVLKPGFLDKLNPDLIVGDEIHKLKNLRAAVTRRVGRYMEAHPETKFIGMSGTITKRSLRDYAHLAEWALGKIAPVPLSWPILSEWADCLDEDIDATNRLAAGALIQLCNDEEKKALKNEDPVSVIRRAYRRRLVETPGVVATVETLNRRKKNDGCEACEKTAILR